MEVLLKSEDRDLSFEVMAITKNGVLVRLKDGEEIWCTYE
jgi:hypothetical protein